jgi:nucleotide-binding universal stress UspA family protein
MKRILVPTDFSANSKHALHVAAGIAQKAGAQLEILHANTAVAYAPPLPDYYGPPAFDWADYNETAIADLHSIKNELIQEDKSGKLPIETRLEEGFLYSTIRRIANEDSIDLIVMGTKGASGATEFFVGSNTEKVIRTAPCPVLSVPERSGDFHPHTVVLATTLQPGQSAVFQELAKWQHLFHFKVKVLYLNNPAEFDSNADIDAAVEAIAQPAGLKDVSSFVGDSTFNEEAAILRFASEQKADMIVMGTHQRQGLSHLLFGSLTEDTVNHSPAPVLSIPIH